MNGNHSSGDTAPLRDISYRDAAPLAAGALVLFALVASPTLLRANGLEPEVVGTSILGMMLAALTAIDIKTLRLPNALTYTLGLLGLAHAYLAAPDDLIFRALGAVAGFAMLAIIAEAYRKYRGKDGLGLGDAKLLGAGGAWIGLAGLPSALLIASSVALVLALLAKAIGRDIGPDTRIPFGPFIAMGLWIVWLFGPIV